eukprot:TRINITY_DN11507_c0_g2_i1.p1 TRINITY_DN11507_c0_g2~~TRINITY_DN11507_c0_g2_i1.p1  ORF type:complete len:333 (-),score=75.57 TRINITY_DN11507_c0_g2_i1:49-1047(-)
MAFLFKPACTIDIDLKDKESKDKFELKREKGPTETFYLFVSQDPVRGNVSIEIPPGKTIEHTGIKIELIGQIELFSDRGNHFEFLNLFNELAPAGVLTEGKTFPFEFLNVEKQNESYNGKNVKLRYLLRVTISRGMLSSNITKELDFWVQNYSTSPEINNTIKMEVGIEDCLHIEFEYSKSKYHLKDVIVGKVYFLLVRIKVKHMELGLVRKETTGTGVNVFHENENLTKFEIMDGAPVRGESIPVRLFLGGFNLTPTYRHVHNKFSVRYYLNLVLVDDDDRRYFKQQEIVLWRKQPRKTRTKKAKQLQALESSDVPAAIDTTGPAVGEGKS